MKYISAAFLLLVAVALTALANSLPAPPTAVELAELEVRQLNTEEVQAFLHSDVKTLSHLWSDDFVVTNPLNKFIDKQQVLGMLQSGFLVMTSLDREIQYLRIYGGVAILAGTDTVIWGGKMPTAGKTQVLRFTTVWMKQDGRWQQVARHANIVPQP